MSIQTAVEVPETLEAAAKRLKELGPDGRAIGGGIDVFGEIHDGTPSPKVVIPIRKIPGTSYIQYRGTIHLGGATTIREISESTNIKRVASPLTEAALSIGTPQIRSQATIAGNLLQSPRCWYVNNGVTRKGLGIKNDPAVNGDPRYHGIFETGPTRAVNGSDMAVAAMALGATIRIVTASGEEKSISIDKFYVEPDENLEKYTVMEEGDIIKELSMQPMIDRVQGIFLKVTEPGGFNYPLVSVALVYNNYHARFSKMQLVIGGVAPRPIRAEKTMDILMSEKKMNRKIIPIAAKSVTEGATPLPENEYKLALIQNLVERALRITYDRFAYTPD